MLMKRGSKAELILKTLGNGALLTVEILDEFFNYPESYRRARSRLFGGQMPRQVFAHSSSSETQCFYSLLNGLKRQGFIVKKKSISGSLWNIIATGLDKLRWFKDNKINYTPASDNKIKIIIFDIPERLKKQRA